MEKISLANNAQPGFYGVFDQSILKDVEGNVYVHFDSQPKIPDKLAQATGKSQEALVDEFQGHFRKSVEHSVASTNEKFNLGIKIEPHTNSSQSITYKLLSSEGKPVNFGGGDLLDALNNSTPHAEGVNELLSAFHAGENHYLPFHADRAAKKLVGSVAHPNMVDALKLPVGTIYFGAGQAKRDAAYLDKTSGALAEIEKALAPAELKDFRYVSSGRGSTCLKATCKTGKEVALMINPASMRQSIPHHLQPLAKISHGDMYIEVLPLLNTDGVTSAHNKHLADGIHNHVDAHKTTYTNEDPALRNLGLSHNGNTYFLDGDGLQRLSAEESTKYLHEATGSMDHHWVNSDGTWKQYTDFKAEHELFNSPLHQDGGKLVAPPPPPPIKPLPIDPHATPADIPPWEQREALVTAEPMHPNAVSPPPVAEPIAPTQLVPPPVESKVPTAPPPSVPRVEAEPIRPAAVPPVPPSVENPPIINSAENTAAHAGSSLSRFWSEGKWAGRKGLIVGGATAAVGAVAYLASRHSDPQKSSKGTWEERVKQPSAGTGPLLP